MKIPWKDNIINIKDLSSDPWTTKYNLELIKETKIIFTYEYKEFRSCVDYCLLRSKDILIFCYTNYIDNKSHIIIDFLKLDDDIKLINQHKIKMDYSLNGLIGKLSIYGNSYYVTYGDQVNYNYFSCILFNLHSYDEPIKIELNDNKLIEELYLLSPSIMIYSNVVSYKNNIEITLLNTELSNIFSLSSLSLNDTIIDNKEYDSIIYDLFTYNNNLYCLLRITLYEKIDVLHIKDFFLDVIIEVNGEDSKIVCMLKSINYSKPFWVIKNGKLQIL